MRIALVVTGGFHPSRREEVVPALLWLVERLARRHDVHVFAVRHLPQARTYPLVGAAIHDLGRPRGPWRQWRALGQALAADGPFDLVHGWWADPSGALAAVAARRLHIPSVVTCDSGEFVALPDIGYGLQHHARGRAAVRIVCRYATRVHVTTAFMEAAARRFATRVVRIPIGVAVDRLATPAPRLEGPPWRLLQVASLNAVKDQRTLLAALARARATLDVRLDLVGEDTLGGRLQDEAARLGLGSSVTFHGFLPHDALAPLHHRAHLYVQSSRHEAGGVAVLEAAAAGIPIVGTRVGHLSDLAPLGAAAVPPGDAVALASAIVTLLERPDHRAALARVAHEFAVTHDADRSSHALLELYDSLAADRAGS